MHRPKHITPHSSRFFRKGTIAFVQIPHVFPPFIKKYPLRPKETPQELRIIQFCLEFYLGR